MLDYKVSRSLVSLFTDIFFKGGEIEMAVCEGGLLFYVPGARFVVNL